MVRHRQVILGDRTDPQLLGGRGELSLLQYSSKIRRQLALASADQSSGNGNDPFGGRGRASSNGCADNPISVEKFVARQCAQD